MVTPDTSNPWCSKRRRYKVEAAASCDGLHCRPGDEEHALTSTFLPGFIGPHSAQKPRSREKARRAIADLTDAVARLAKIPPDEAADRVFYGIVADKPLSTVPIDAFHAHLIVWGMEPDAGPWYYALAEDREGR